MVSAHAVCYIKFNDGCAYIDNTGYYEFENDTQLGEHVGQKLDRKIWTSGAEIIPDYSLNQNIKIIKAFVNPDIPEEIKQELEESHKWLNQIVEIMDNLFENSTKQKKVEEAKVRRFKRLPFEIMLPFEEMMLTSEDSESVKEISENVKFIRSLDLNKLEQLIADMKYVPYHRYRHVKPAKVEVDTKNLEDLIKLIDLYNHQVSREITDKKKFFKIIMKTSDKLGDNDYENWDIPGLIRWSTNLVRYWSTYNDLMTAGSRGVGFDINGDGIGDKINFKNFVKLPSNLRDKAKLDPRAFEEEYKKEIEKVDKTNLDLQLEQTTGEEGKLMLICRNLATLNQLIYENSKHLNPNSRNTYCFRVRDSGHVWNMFATVNEQGIFVTSVDPTFSDNGKRKFSKRAKLDYTSPTHKEDLWNKNYVHLMAGSVLRREKRETDAVLLLFRQFIKNSTSDLAVGIADSWYVISAYKGASKYYKFGESDYAKYRYAFCLHKLGKYEESNQALEGILKLYDENNPSTYRDNAFFDEALPLRAWNFYHLGNYNEAIKDLNLSLEVSSSYKSLVLNWLHKSYLAIGDTENAELALEKYNLEISNPPSVDQ